MYEETVEVVVKQDTNGTNKVITGDYKNIQRQVSKAMDIFDDIFDEMIYRSGGGMTF